MIDLGEVRKCDYCGENVPVIFAVSVDGGKTVGHRICVAAHMVRDEDATPDTG